MARISVRNFQVGDTGDGRARSIDLEIGDREFLAITGPPGAGKSSLLRSIAGLESGGSGEIAIGDRESKGRDVGMVFATDALYPRMSIRETLAYGLRARKFSTQEIDRRVEDCAATLGIADLLKRRPRELSALERRRCAIARAVVQQPKILLFDEPLAGLDGAERGAVRKLIVQLREQMRATFVYATCHAADAVALGERIAVMQSGGIEQTGTPSEIYDSPRNLFVAGFVGSPWPMNFVNGTLKLDRDCVIFTESQGGTIQLQVPLLARLGLEEFSGKPATLGIRPENISVTSPDSGTQPQAGEFPALIDLVERGGAETILHLDSGGHKLLCRTRKHFDAASGQHRGRFAIDVEKVIFFDPSTTLRIG